MKSLIVREAIHDLSTCPQDAVLGLCVDDYPYAPFKAKGIIYEPSDDGPGCVLLTLKPESEIASVLRDQPQSEPPVKVIKLPVFGIVLKIRRNHTGGGIVSDLPKLEDEPSVGWNAGVDAIENMILTHAMAGVNVEAPAYLEGIETAVEALADYEYLEQPKKGRQNEEAR